MRLGVEIVYVGLDAVHPPVEVAPEYEKVLEAERRQESRRFAAEGDAAAMLAEVAGDSSIALKLALAIRIDNELEILLDAQGDPARYDTLLDDDLARIKSDIANLDIEIARDQLLGRMRADTRGTIQLTSPQELRGLYAAYQAQLNQIKEAGAKDRASLKATLASAVTAARASADALLGRSLGQSASIIARARADRWTQELAEMALAEVFQKNLTAYNANPEVFMADRRMEVWEEVLPNMSKFVLAVDRSKVDVWLDWSLQRSLMSEVNIESLKPR